MHQLSLRFRFYGLSAEYLKTRYVPGNDKLEKAQEAACEKINGCKWQKDVKGGGAIDWEDLQTDCVLHGFWVCFHNKI